MQCRIECKGIITKVRAFDLTPDCDTEGKLKQVIAVYMLFSQILNSCIQSDMIVFEYTASTTDFNLC